MKITVTVRETLEKEVTINAKNCDEAFDKVKEQYENEDIVLDYSDYINTEFFIKRT